MASFPQTWGSRRSPSPGPATHSYSWAHSLLLGHLPPALEKLSKGCWARNCQHCFCFNAWRLWGKWEGKASQSLWGPTLSLWLRQPWLTFRAWPHNMHTGTCYPKGGRGQGWRWAQLEEAWEAARPKGGAAIRPPGGGQLPSLQTKTMAPGPSAEGWLVVGYPARATKGRGVRASPPCPYTQLDPACPPNPLVWTPLSEHPDQTRGNGARLPTAAG